MTRAVKKRVKIVGTGFYAPPKVLTNFDLEKMVDTSDEWIVTRSGIKERRIAGSHQATSDLCIEASRAALRNTGLEVKDLDLIIVATSTPDTIFPATACWVQRGLRADHVPAFDISAACTGFLYGMILAESLILNGITRRILLVGAELLSKVVNWEDRSTCVLFGDAAGAVIMEKSEDSSGVLSHYWGADGNLTDLLFLPAGGTRTPASIQTVNERLHYLQMKGNEVFKHAVKRMGEAAVEALKRAGIRKEDIRYFIPHQAKISIIEATAKRLKLPQEKVLVNIHKYGNVSAATIPIGLHELNQEGKLRKGDIILMDAFGAGFTWAAVVYRW